MLLLTNIRLGALFAVVLYCFATLRHPIVLPGASKCCSDRAPVQSLVYSETRRSGKVLYDIRPAFRREDVQRLLTPAEQADLLSTCNRVISRTLTTATVVHGFSERVYVATGDIDAMWLRDSAVQVSILLQAVHMKPFLQPLLDGLLRTHAYMILQDPYANSFRKGWREPKSEERPLRRGGWVDTGNWEPDSLAYFLHFLAGYASTPDLMSSEAVLNEPVIFRAVLLVLRTFQTEQRHSELSQYRYAELPNDGLGAPVGYTGMVWGGYRPSDDAQTYGYNIPVNMYVHSGLEKLLKLNSVIYKSEGLRRDAAKLIQDIRDGIRTHGIVNGIYAYEVDGLGNALIDFDDANIPSLLSAPLLNFSDLQAGVYAATRKRVLSSHNPQFFSGPTFEGIGSPHTPLRHAWPLAVMARALTASHASEAAQSIQFLLRMRCGDGLMHESVHVDQPDRCTRPSFEWANTLFVQLVWTIFPDDVCSLASLDAAHIRHE